MECPPGCSLFLPERPVGIRFFGHQSAEKADDLRLIAGKAVLLLLEVVLLCAVLGFNRSLDLERTPATLKGAMRLKQRFFVRLRLHIQFHLEIAHF